MKKIIFYFIVLIGISSQVNAQTFCHTPATVPDLLQQISPARLAAPSSNYVLRIFVHVMRRSNGTGGQSQADVTQGLNFVVADFATHGICVSLLGSDEIWNDGYYNMSDPSGDGNGDGVEQEVAENWLTEAIAPHVVILFVIHHRILKHFRSMAVHGMEIPVPAVL